MSIGRRTAPRSVRNIAMGHSQHAKKTLLMISPFVSPNIGGVESHIDKLLQHLPALGFTTLVVSYQPLTTHARGPEIERRPDITIRRTPWFGHGWFPILEAYFPLQFLWLFPGLWFASLRYYLREYPSIAVIHAHGLIAATIAKLLPFKRCRTVISIHAIYHFSERQLLLRLWIAWVLQSADAIIAVGSPAIAELSALGIDRRRFSLLRNWVDVNKFKPVDRAAARQRLEFSGFTILFIGRLLAKKGIPLLVEAAQLLPETTFVFVGDGPEAAALTHVAAQLPNVSFRGSVLAHELVAYYTAADVFASPALYDEGAAAVFLEAIACGTPVIASRLGCTSDYLHPSVAILIEPTISALVNSLSELSTDPDRLARMRSACRAYAEQHYSDRNIDVFQHSYNGRRAKATILPRPTRTSARKS